MRRAVVVGSGYGGSVAALRLAQHGVQVTVLERGNEYVAGDFPDGLGKAMGQLRVERNGAAGVTGLESGLFDIRVGQNINALVGNALGGGSQINANVLMRPDPRVFLKSKRGRRLWPKAINDQDLGQFFDHAERELGGERFTKTFLGSAGEPPEPLWGTPHKAERLNELRELIDAQLRSRPGLRCLASTHLNLTLRCSGYSQIELDQRSRPPEGFCVGCGECVAGCNFNAKKTLTHTYLPRARSHGAVIYTGVTVLRVEKLDDGAWKLQCLPTHDLAAHRAGAEVAPLELLAEHVFLAAGTFGSTEILLRSRSASLCLSSELGKGLSGNGDGLAVAFQTRRPVNGIGVGSAGFVDQGAGVGPTITGSIRVTHAHDVEQEVQIQDAAIPRALAGVFDELITTSAAMHRLPRWRWRTRRPGGSSFDAATDWSTLDPQALLHSQTLLLMGHDRARGVMRLDARTDRLVLKQRRIENLRVGDLQWSHLRAATRHAELLLENPLLQPLPRSITGMLDGPTLAGSSFTVHPLGGCRMADSAADGVVDDCGRVLDGASAGGRSSVHRGLYVLDGSIVASSLGVNPMLTITALAERAMHHILTDDLQLASTPVDQGAAKAPETSPSPIPMPIRARKKTFAPVPRDVPVRFTEVMRSNTEPHPPPAHVRCADNPPAFLWQGQRADARLILHLPLASLEGFAADPSHTVSIHGRGGPVMLLGDDGEPAHLRVDTAVSDSQCQHDHPPRMLANLRVVGGTVQLLPVRQLGIGARVGAFLRSLATWLLERGLQEIWLGASQLVHARPATAVAPAGIWAKFTGLLKLAWHASELRTMEYRLQLRDEVSRPHLGRHYLLLGTKRVGYPATTSELARALWPPFRLQRTNVWVAFSRMETRVYDAAGHQIGRGALSLDLVDMTRFHAPQLGARGNTPDALVALAGYPLWMLRLLIKTRLWDFRLPHYPAYMPDELAPGRKVPPAWFKDPPTPWPRFPDLDTRSGLVKALDSEELLVQRSEDCSDRLSLRLTRYPATKLRSHASARHPGVVICRTVLLLNGFAQSTLGFVPEEHERAKGEMGLATFFHEQGFDVWLFDYRTSSILESSKQLSNMDQIAAYDIPAAVNRVLAVMREELKLSSGTPVQIHAFAHCVGAAALAMSLLSGRLQQSARPSDQEHACGKLAAVVLSQFQPFVVGSATAQMRLGLAALARDMLGIEYFRLSAAERQPTTFESLLDRVFASLPVPPGEECPGEHDHFLVHPDICTCKRMSGTISRLLRHDRIKTETHRKLPIYFGRANTGVLAHGSRCVENERLVNADGQNIYVTDENIKKYLRLPIALLHGEHNALFDVESTRRTLQQLRRLHADLCDDQVIRSIIAPSHAHFDCTIGFGPAMECEILDPLQRFFDCAERFHARPMAAETQATPLHPRALAPRSGPVIGWTRRHSRAGKSGVLVRLWMEADQGEADRSIYAVTRLLAAGTHKTQLWPVSRVPLDNWPTEGPWPTTWRGSSGSHAHVRMAVADVFLDDDMLQSGEPVRIEMFDLREFEAPPGGEILPANHVLPNHMRAIMELAANDGVPAGAQPLGPAVFLPDHPLIAVIDDVEHRLGEVLDAYRLEQKRKNELAARANPGTLSRKQRSSRPANLASPGEVTILPSALRLDSQHALSFLAACCRHPGLPFERVRASHVLMDIDAQLSSGELAPQFMFMLGDQVYADATAGLADSPSPIERIAQSTSRALASEGVHRVGSRLPLYMVMDDHEIVDGWSEDARVFSDQQSAAHTAEQRLRNAGLGTFAAFQWLHSPCNLGLPGFNYQLQAPGSAFFVLDTRTQRRRRTEPPTICDPQQLDALAQWLDQTPQTLKFIVTGSVLVPGLADHDNGSDGALPARAADNWQLAPPQRTQVLHMIANCQSKNVVLLSGDYHCSAVSTLTLRPAAGTDIKTAYAIVCPPLYAPYPGINIHPEDLQRQESIDLGDGLRAEIDTPWAWQGMGFAEIGTHHDGAGAWLQVTLRLTLWDSPQAPKKHFQRLRLPLAPPG